MSLQSPINYSQLYKKHQNKAISQVQGKKNSIFKEHTLLINHLRDKRKNSTRSRKTFYAENPVFPLEDENIKYLLYLRKSSI